LSAIKKGICAFTDTRWIIVALVVVRECTPLGSSVNDTITKDETAGSTDHVTRSKLLNKVGWILLAVWADHVKI
jgi:hypothetical protein